MSNAKHFAGIIESGRQLFLAQMLVSILAIVNLGLLTRWVPKDVLALIPVTLSLGTMGQLLVNFGLPTACIRLIPEMLARSDNEPAEALVRTTLLVTVGFLVIFLAFVGLKSAWVAQLLLKSAGHKESIMQMLPFVLFFSLAQTLSLIIQGFNEFQRLSVVLLVSNFVQQLLIFPAYLLAGMSGVILLALPAGPIIQIGMFLPVLGKKIFQRGEFYSLKGLVKFAVPFYGFGYVRFLSSEADQLVVAALFPPADLAVYYVARRFSQALFGFLSAFYLPLMPRIGQYKEKGRVFLSNLFTGTTRYIGFIAIPVCLFMAVMAHPIIDRVAGGGYGEAGWILTIKALSMLAYAVYTLYGQNIFYLANPNVSLVLEAGNGTLTIAAAVWLGFYGGIIGFAAGSLIGYIGAALLGNMIIKRYLDPQFDWPALRWIAAAALIFCGVIIFPQLMHWDKSIVWSVAAVGSIIFVGYFMARLEDDDVNILSEIIPAGMRPWFLKGRYKMREIFNNVS